MASWIVHLRIAERSLAAFPGLDPALFAIGNIAPDSGVPDEKWERFDPPPKVTHFIPADTSIYRSGDLEFYRRNLAHLPWPGSPAGLYSFRLGYFFHLIIDNLWYQDIDKPVRSRFAEQFEADKDFIWEVKRDWYGIEQFISVRSWAWNAVFFQ